MASYTGERDNGGTYSPGRVVHLYEVSKQYGCEGYAQFIYGDSSVGFELRGAVLAGRGLCRSFWGRVNLTKEERCRKNSTGDV